MPAAPSVSMQFQIFQRKPGTMMWMSLYPAKGNYFNTEHEALEWVKIYTDWDKRHGQFVYEYCVARVTTKIEFGEAVRYG